VILVRVVPVVDEDHARLHLPDHRLQAHDELAVERDLGVAVAAPEDLARAHDQRGVVLLATPHRGAAAHRPVGGDVEIDVVAPLGVLRQHAAAPVLDVVRVCADG